MAPLAVPSRDGLNWSKIRAMAKERAAAAPTDEVVAMALPLLDALDAPHRMLAVYWLGFTAGAQPENLAVLRERATPDASWEVQEALAQAFDATCAARGYEAALPLIDDLLAGAHPNIRRAVSERLRPRTAHAPRYFSRHADESILR